MTDSLVHVQQKKNMRRKDNAPHRNMTVLGPVTFPETNLEVWVPLGEEPRNTNPTILETVHELKNKMAPLQADNEWLMLD